ncbi:MAG: hypothetical protein SXQ77_04990 [Halobacteria archaeon]|nr:hypothetical protein [Halobacteria archaeon]
MVIQPHTASKKEFLKTRAIEVFEDLGYSVNTNGETVTAKRGGKIVEVATLTRRSNDICPYQWEDDKYCFVVDMSEVDEFESDVYDLAPPGSDCAVIGVDESDYEVY